MAKIGIDKIVKEILPEREEQRRRSREEVEEVKQKKAKEQAIEDRSNKLAAERWIEKILPGLIKAAARKGDRKIKLGTSEGLYFDSSENKVYIPWSYLIEALRAIDDIRVTSDYYQGSGRYDEGWGYDHSYYTYYLEWDEPE